MVFSERYCASCGAANTPEAEVCFACGLSFKITAALYGEGNEQHLLQQRYRILTQVGKGGFSAVFRALDTHYANHPVAIKAITLNGLRPSEVIEATEAFNREILLLSGLKHPNLPRIHAHFSTAECWYLVMDFIEGNTLEKHLETMPAGCLPLGEVFEVGLLLCNVLEYLHSRQPAIIYRDLKPANIMVTPGGRIALIDFGIARYYKLGQAKDTLPFGSPGYAAPEQYGKAQSTTRTDIYGLGVTLHQLLSGNDPSLTPFHFAPFAPATEEPMLTELEALIMRMIAIDALQRPANIGEVKQELQRIADAWLSQQRYGLSARTAYPGYSAAMHALSSSLPGTLSTPSSSATGMASVAGRMGMSQMSFATQPTMGFGPNATQGGSANAYWGATQSKRWNGLAIASLIFGILSIIVPFFFCVSSSSLSIFYFSQDDAHFWVLLPMFLMLVPSICAIIFGHSGKRRANTIPALSWSRDIAATGMVMGYIFGSIYLGFFCILFTIFMSYR